MAAKIATRVKTRREHLRQLAIVFKVEIRLEIVAELYIREMSPKEFFDEFGGGTVERVAQHFEELERHGWLRKLGQKGREAKRRGVAETLYRATELPFFDAETWALLPYSLRLASSWNAFQAHAKELRKGMEGACFEGRRSRDMTCTSIEVDDLGWMRVIRRLDSVFEAIFEEQDDAKIRAARTGGELSRIGVLQVGFESPRNSDQLGLGLAGGVPEPLIAFPERLAPVFADDLCIKILEELNRSKMSMHEFHRRFAKDESWWAVRYRFERLKKLAWLTVVDRIKKRGSYEHIYRATGPVLKNNEPWADVPDSLRKTAGWEAFERFSDLVKEAIAKGTFDIRDDRHLSWSNVHLDQDGWENRVRAVNGLAAFLKAEQRQAKKRIAKGAKPLTMVVGLAIIESPIGRVKAP